MLSFKTAKAVKPFKIMKKDAKVKWAEREITFQVKANGRKRRDNPAYYVRMLEASSEYRFMDEAKVYAKQYADSMVGNLTDEVGGIIANEIDLFYLLQEWETGKKINKVNKLIDKKVIEYAYHYVSGFRRFVMKKKSKPKMKYSSIKSRTPHISNPHRFFKPISGLNISHKTHIESGDLINSFTANVYNHKKQKIVEVN